MGPKERGRQNLTFLKPIIALFSLKRTFKQYNYFEPYQMQIQLLEVCTFISSVAEIAILFNMCNFQKVQRALENVLAGTFLPPGSGLATPGLRYKNL